MLFPIAAMLFAQTVAAQQPMEMDKPISFGPLQIACSGVGSAKDDPEWKAYPIRIEFSNAAAQYLSGAHVTISMGGKQVADLNCAGPWVLVQGQAGSYRVEATINGAGPGTASADFKLTSGGPQKRVVLRFKSEQANE